MEQVNFKELSKDPNYKILKNWFVLGIEHKKGVERAQAYKDFYVVINRCIYYANQNNTPLPTVLSKAVQLMPYKDAYRKATHWETFKSQVFFTFKKRGGKNVRPHGIRYNLKILKGRKDKWHIQRKIDFLARLARQKRFKNIP